MQQEDFLEILARKYILRCLDEADIDEACASKFSLYVYVVHGEMQRT